MCSAWPSGGITSAPGSFRSGRVGASSEPGVGEDVELQFDEAADHRRFAGLQGGLDAQLGFGGEGGRADQGDEQGAEFCGE
jgi:hypothetical protein